MAGNDGPTGTERDTRAVANGCYAQDRVWTEPDALRQTARMPAAARAALLRDRLLGLALAAPDREVCALLGGPIHVGEPGALSRAWPVGDRATRAVPIPNVVGLAGYEARRRRRGARGPAGG